MGYFHVLELVTRQSGIDPYSISVMFKDQFRGMVSRASNLVPLRFW